MRGIFYFLYYHPAGLMGQMTEGVLWYADDVPLEGTEQFRSFNFWLGREG